MTLLRKLAKRLIHHRWFIFFTERPLKWSDLKRPICWVRGHDVARYIHPATRPFEVRYAYRCARCNKPQPEPEEPTQ